MKAVHYPRQQFYTVGYQSLKDNTPKFLSNWRNKMFLQIPVQGKRTTMQPLVATRAKVCKKRVYSNTYPF